MLPQLALLTVPIPSILLLALLTLYHLTPLLSLLPNLHLMPLLHRLSTIIPHPRKRNLPREFFNLPPRPGSPSEIEDVYVIGIRGKVMLLLLAQATLSLGCGWAYLATSPVPKGINDGLGAWWRSLLAALAVTPLPATVFALALYSRGGITHHSILRRILPLSTVLVVAASGVTAGVASRSSFILLAITSLFTACILLASAGGLTSKLQGSPIRGQIRLSASPELQSPERVKVMTDGESWLTSPSQASTTDYSAFSYSPSVATPKHKRSRHFDDMPDGSPKSWLTSPSTTPSTIPAWDYSPCIATPEPARTRPASPRSPSPSLETTALVVGQLPRAPVNRLLDRAKASQATTAGNTTHTHTTLSGTPGSMQSPGGSIIAWYETDLSRPMPRGFESLTSYPVSPAQLKSLGYSPGTFPHPNFSALVGSRISLTMRAGRSGDDIAFIPEERRSISGNGSTWTLESYHSAQETPMADFKTPIKSPRTTDRRAPPPPPIPMDLPLPPTPTATSHSPTITVWDGKESAEYLLGEREWVEVDSNGDGVDGWSKEGKGVGIVAVITVLLNFGLTAPLLVSGLYTYAQALFLAALLIPAPILLVTSYLLRYRPLPTTRVRRKKESTRSESTHKSLALVSISQLSLPLSISPKLTPPNHRRSTEPTARWSHFLETKPSVSNFGYNRPRPHTVFGNADAAQVYGSATNPAEKDRLAKRTLARRSTDVWLENGHALPSGSRLSRVGEMLKPVPALRLMEPYQRPQQKSLTRLRGGIVSMMPNRLSGYSGTEPGWNQGDGEVPASPITIHITSPSKHDVRANRASVQSGVSMDDSGASFPSAQIQHAKRGRMGAGPTLVLGKQKTEDDEGYELDWMTAGVLPNLVPHLTIGSEIKIGPGPKQEPTIFHDDFSPAKGSIIRRHNASASISSFDFGSTPARSHGHSTSIDFTSPGFDAAMQSTPHGNFRKRAQLRHKSSFSLPSIHAADFEDVRRSFDECCRPELSAQQPVDMGVDLPPVPAQLVRRDLSTVSERDESNESSRMRQTLYDMGDAILALSSSPGATMGHGDVSLSSTASNLRRARGLGDLAPLIVTSSYIADFSQDFSLMRHSGNSADRSMQSHEEEMAEEMERVMAMDTPTRTEFVISPPPSSYASSFGSRSNSRASHRTTTSEDAPPVPKLDWRFSTPGQSDCQFTDAEEDLPLVPRTLSDISSPQISELDQSVHVTGGFTFAHPHPPPIHQLGTKPSYTSLSHGLTSVPSPHPPIAMQTLKSKNSSETMRSDMTGTTVTTDATPHRIWETEGEPFKPSKQELMMIKTLKERREIARTSVQLDQLEPAKSTVKRSRSALALRSPEKPQRLQQISDSNANRSPLPAVEVAKPKRVAVLREDRLPKCSTESSGARSAKASSGTTGSRKDRKKGSKMSTGSAMTPLRA